MLIGWGYGSKLQGNGNFGFLHVLLCGMSGTNWKRLLRTLLKLQKSMLTGRPQRRLAVAGESYGVPAVLQEPTLMFAADAASRCGTS